MNAFEYIHDFKLTPEWAVMKATVENSPWHREDNVAVHTEMSLDQYTTRFAGARTDRQNSIALISILFHDVGKPEAEEVVDKKDGSGTYRRYAGHEQVSAVAFTEHYLKDDKLRSFLSREDARRVRWIIEHHLPYGLKDTTKVKDFRTATAVTLGDCEETFYDCLRSDAAGRISDDHETKLQNVENWINEFRAIEPAAPRTDFCLGGPAFILIGPSGSGKSTWIGQHLNVAHNDRVVSMDLYRLGLYRLAFPTHRLNAKEEYSAAFKYADENKTIFNTYMGARIKAEFESLQVYNRLNAGLPKVFVDNTNGAKKARARWIQEARNVGLKVVAVEFWNPLDVLLARQKTRNDKEVPYFSVKQQHLHQTCAWLGSEVDEVISV